MELYVCGDPERSSRYTTVAHAEVGAPSKRWTVYINPKHTDYVPLGDEEDRAQRVMALGKKFGLKPIRRIKPDERKKSGSYVLYLVRVPKTDLHLAPEWDGAYVEQGHAPASS